MVPKIEEIASSREINDPKWMSDYVNKTGLTYEKPRGPVEEMVAMLCKREKK
jgi:hypothetical protein